MVSPLHPEQDNPDKRTCADSSSTSLVPLGQGDIAKIALELNNLMIPELSTPDIDRSHRVGKKDQ